MSVLLNHFNSNSIAGKLLYRHIYMAHFTGVYSEFLTLGDHSITAAGDQLNAQLRLQHTEIKAYLAVGFTGIDGLGAQVADISAGDAGNGFLLSIQFAHCIAGGIFTCPGAFFTDIVNQVVYVNNVATGKYGG